MASESIAHEAEGRNGEMGLRSSVGSGGQISRIKEV